PAELARRLNRPKGRPLLQPDVPSAIAALLPTRMARYLEADLVFSTDGKPAAEISRHIDARLPRGGLHRISIDVPGAAHEVTVGFHLTNLAAQALRRLAASRPIMVVSDSHAAGRHIDPLIEALQAAKTWPAPFTNRWRSSLTSSTWRPLLMRSSGRPSPRSPRLRWSPTDPSLIGYRSTWLRCWNETSRQCWRRFGGRLGSRPAWSVGIRTRPANAPSSTTGTRWGTHWNAQRVSDACDTARPWRGGWKWPDD